MLYRMDSALCSLGASLSLSSLTPGSVHRMIFPASLFRPTSLTSPKSAAQKGSLFPGPAHRRGRCRRCTQLYLSTPGPIPQAPTHLPVHFVLGLYLTAEEGEVDTSGRHMSPRSRDSPSAALGSHEAPGRLPEGDDDWPPREGLYPDTGRGTSTGEGQGSSLENLDAAQRPEGTQRSRLGEGPRPGRTRSDPKCTSRLGTSRMRGLAEMGALPRGRLRTLNFQSQEPPATPTPRAPQGGRTPATKADPLGSRRGRAPSTKQNALGVGVHGAQGLGVTAEGGSRTQGWGSKGLAAVSRRT